MLTCFYKSNFEQITHSEHKEYHVSQLAISNKMIYDS